MLKTERKPPEGMNPRDVSTPDVDIPLDVHFMMGQQIKEIIEKLDKFTCTYAEFLSACGIDEIQSARGHLMIGRMQMMEYMFSEHAKLNLPEEYDTLYYGAPCEIADVLSDRYGEYQIVE